jgi:RNA 3'-terminal phosphate cyclase (ATP)
MEEDSPLTTTSSSSSTDYHTLDGAHGEGGGQVLRNGISYAVLLQKAIHIRHIRAGRSKPGLKAQHQAGLALASRVGGGCLTGNDLHATSITYTPPSASSTGTTDYSVDRHVTQDIGTAGSISLLLQAALPVALLSTAGASTRLRLLGGTNATMAPQYDYWERVFLPVLTEQCGLPLDAIQAQVVTRGYFPKGGGHVIVQVQGLDQPLRPVQLVERGQLQSIHLRAFHAGKLPRHLAETMAQAATTVLQTTGLLTSTTSLTVEIVTERAAVGNGLGVLLVATTSTGCRLGGSALCGRGQDAGTTGLQAADELVQAWRDGGCVDDWLQDQLVFFMALAEGRSRLVTGSLTLHTRTALWVAEELAGVTFSVTRLDGEDATGTGSSLSVSETYGSHGRFAGRHLIECTGLGLCPSTQHVDDDDNED